MWAPSITDLQIRCGWVLRESKRNDTGGASAAGGAGLYRESPESLQSNSDGIRAAPRGNLPVAGTPTFASTPGAGQRRSTMAAAVAGDVHAFGVAAERTSLWPEAKRTDRS